MPHYKSPDNAIHFIKSEFSHLLPAGSVEITDEEAESLRPAPVVLPITVTPRQIRQALTASGLRINVESAVAAGSPDLKDWWEFATAFEENHPMVVSMASGLGVSEVELHDLFVLASSL
jgi:hypothetical protein